MNFFKDFKRTFIDPSFYKEVEGGGKKPLPYLINLTLVVALLGTIVSAFFIIPRLNYVVSSVASVLKNRYPAKLVLTIKDGVAETNINKPFFMELTKDEISLLSASGVNLSSVKNILVIDTSKSAYTDFVEINKVSSVIFLAKDGILIKDPTKLSVRIEPLNTFGNLTIDHGFVLNIADNLIKMLKFLAPIFLIFLFVALFVLLFLYGLIVALAAALFVWLIKSIKDQNVMYKSALNVSIYSVTPSIIFSALLLVFEGFVLTIPVAVLLTLALWALNNLRFQNASKAVNQ
jgi:hypothetical protein